MEQIVAQSSRTVVLLGEGNFSYALARLRLHLANVASRKMQAHLRMIATSFDSQAQLFQKYPESVQILQKMHQLSAKEDTLSVQVLHDVDATRIHETLPLAAELSEGVDEVTFCHPHIGSEDLRRNSALVAHFFHSAKTSFPSPPKLLQLTLLQSQYERWHISQLEQLNGLRLLGQHLIDPAVYTHGYETRRHQSGKSFSTSKVGKNFTIQSMAYIYTLIDISTPTQEEETFPETQFVLDCGAIPYIDFNSAEESKVVPAQTQAQQQQSFNCPTCNKEFSSERALKNHEKSHVQENEETKEQDQKAFVCSHCQRNFASEDGLVQHVRSKHEQGGKASLSADYKGIILEICTEPGPENCPICGQASHGADYLQPPKELSLECPYCQRAFVNQRALTQHSTLSCKLRPKE